MVRIYVGGAGGAPANNFIAALRLSARPWEVIGGCSVATDLMLADVARGYLVPAAKAPGYADRLLAILAAERPDMLHVQHDYEVLAVSEMREEIKSLGVRMLLPAKQTVRDCVDKFRSYELWERSNVRPPVTVRVDSEADLDRAFAELGPKIWLRATTGGGGRGALPTSDREFARLWIEQFQGWGAFTAAEMLTASTVTWSSLWLDGRLVVAQTRKRASWSFGDRTLSGVTGVTAVGETAADETVDDVAMGAILAVDPQPNGIFSVDMTYDKEGVPRPTEINIGRFFTTIQFFAEAGLNMPEIYCDLALTGQSPWPEPRVNPLAAGLVWLRGMDVAPRLCRREDIDALIADGVMNGAP
jgi:carbamoyl-phosphate synthase large subunit